MSQGQHAVDEDQTPKLGPRFWVVWWVGLAVLAAAFAIGLSMLAPRMLSPWGAVAGGLCVIAFTLAFIGWSFVPMRTLQKRGHGERMRPATRRYMRRFLPAMLGYVVVLLGSLYYANTAHPSGIVAWLVALAPTVPVLLAIRAIALVLIEEDDEYLRERLYRTFALATTWTLAACTVWGFLDTFELVPHVALWAVFPLWASCIGPAQLLLNRGRR
jgi:hypothetical protein